MKRENGQAGANRVTVYPKLSTVLQDLYDILVSKEKTYTDKIKGREKKHKERKKNKKQEEKRQE